jgi:DNA-dependent protein kinase catalytic subunit
VLVRIMDFLCILYGKYAPAAAKLCARLWTDAAAAEAMWDVVVALTLQPTALGFNMADVEVMQNLPEQVCVRLLDYYTQGGRADLP